MASSSNSSSPLPWDVPEAGPQDQDGAKESSTSIASNSSNGPRRTKAMSIGNAASLFGAPPSPAGNEEAAAASADLFSGTSSGGSGNGNKRSSPVVSKGSAFASIGEEAEPASGDAGDAANLFSSLAAGGDAQIAGQQSQPAMDWLGATQQPLAPDAQVQQQQPYYAQPYSNQALSGDPMQGQQQQYAYYDQNAAYAGQQYSSQQYACDDSSAPNGMYADPSGQQAYQANLQAQAHAAQQPMQNAYTQGYDNMSASYYQQPQSAYQQSYQPQQYQQNTAYDANSQYLGMPQQQPGAQQVPYTAPAAAGYTNQMAYSQAQVPSAGSSAPTYGYDQQSHTYDPYALPASDPYAPAQSSSKPALNHSMTQPAIAVNNTAYDPYSVSRQATSPPQLVHSATSSAIATTGSKLGDDSRKQLNRSKSSFFAELPPMPAPKSRPPSSMSNMRGVGGANVAPAPPMSAAGSPKIPPPPKSRTPAPPARPGSAASVSRPASRTAQRQGSLASSVGGRSSVDQSAQYATYPQAGSSYAQSNGSGSARQSLDGNYGQNSMYADPRSYATSPPPQQAYQSGRQSMDSNYSQGQSYAQQQPYHRPSTLQQSPYGQDQTYQQYGNGQSAQQPQYHDTNYAASQSSYNQQTMDPYAAQPNKTEYDPYSGGANQSTAGQRFDQHSDFSQRVQSPSIQQRQQALPPPTKRSQAGMPELSPRSVAQPLPPIQDMSGSTSVQSSVAPAESIAQLQHENGADAALDSITASLQKTSLDQPEPVRQREETSASAVSIAQTHDEVDELPVHAELAANVAPDAENMLEPYERSITLDAYLPPSPAAIEQRHDFGSQAPTSEAAASETPAEERQAELELQSAERDLDRQLYAEDGGELEMLADGGSQVSGLPPSSSYDNYDPYGYSSQPNGYSAVEPYNAEQGSYSNIDGGSDPYAASKPYDPYSAPTPQEAPLSDPYYVQAYRADPYQQPADQDPYDSQGSYAGTQAGLQPQSTSTYDPYASRDVYAPQESLQYGTSPISSMVNGRLSSEANRPPIPAVSFGFNGRLVTFFPSASTSYAGASSYSSPYSDPSSSAAGSAVAIRNVSSLLPTEAAALEAFPGPVFMDQGATSGAGKTKKRKEVVAWLDASIEAVEKEASYISSVANDPRKREAEEKGILYKLVKILLENDGKLSGSPKIDEAVRTALVPQLANAGVASLPTAADLKQDVSVNLAAASATDADLDAIQSYLVQGDKREAVRYALDRKLWAHALVIASGVDKELSASVTREFVQAELSQASARREPLKVAYSLLSGAGQQSIQDFLPPRNLAAASASSFASAGRDPYAPASRSATPMPGLDHPSDVPAETLSKWRETAAIIVANRSPSDVQSLTVLGDVLFTNGWLKAAHACYLLSGQMSLLGGPGVPGVRYGLIGARHALQTPTSARDMEAIMLTEVVEFALSFIPVVKGQEPYIGLPYLQGYRTMHALELSDMGMHSSAQKYCDALGATLKLATKASPFYHPALLAQIKDLSDRLSLVSFQDKSGSWISRKVQRPTLDNMWSTLEGRFTKFVAGEVEEDPAAVARKKAKQDAAKGVAGPFAHYSSITPTGMDSLSRNASSTDLSMRATPPPQPTSVPNTVTRTGTVKQTHHRRSSSYGYGPYGADPYPPYMNTMPDTVEEAETSMEAQEQAGQQQNVRSNEPQYGYVTPQNDTGWWGSANGSQNASPYGASAEYGQQPEMYSPVVEGNYAGETSEGLMSPMAYQQSSPMTASSSQTQYGQQSSSLATSSTLYDEDDDELGLGNNSNRKGKNKLSASEPASSSTPKEEPPAPKKEEPTVRPAASSSWLGRIFRREGGSPQQGSGPIRAKLGEETSFVYDPVEKRWVNKKAGADTPPPAPVVPPPRAQTASPSTAARGSFASQMATPPAPVMRASTASPPVRTQPPAAAAASATPPPPAPAGGATPPPPRPATTATPAAASGELPPPPKKPAGGAAARKNVRNRYVDVFAQQQQGKS